MLINIKNILFYQILSYKYKNLNKIYCQACGCDELKMRKIKVFYCSILLYCSKFLLKVCDTWKRSRNMIIRD